MFKNSCNPNLQDLHNDSSCLESRLNPLIRIYMTLAESSLDLLSELLHASRNIKARNILIIKI